MRMTLHRLVWVWVLAILGAMDVAAAAELQVVEPSQSRARPYVLERTTQWTLRSKSGRTFEVSVAMPSVAAPESGYPVLYVLDPQHSFATLTETVRNHESMFGPVIVVGVGYASESEGRNRIYDLTPPSTDAAKLPAMYPGGWGPVGGADKFLEFMLNEVRPAISAFAKVDSERQALFGHSLGGLFVLHVLFTQPHAFDTYVAASPSIWWSEKVILQERRAFERRLEDLGKHRRLLITVGKLEEQTNPEELRLIRQLKLSGAETMAKLADMVGNAHALNTSLAEVEDLEVRLVVFGEETHNSSIPAYLGRGARFTLAGWNP